VQSSQGAAGVALFGFAYLSGGLVNASPGGGAGLLASGAMVTNGTAGLSPGGIISTPASAALGGPDVLFGVQGFAVRSLFPATLAVGGSAQFPELPREVPQVPWLFVIPPLPAEMVDARDGAGMREQAQQVGQLSNDLEVAAPGSEVPILPAPGDALPSLGGEAGAQSDQPETHSRQSANIVWAPEALLSAPAVDTSLNDCAAW
jgi:hypothetical protein